MPPSRPMIRSPSRKPCSPRWPPSSPAPPRPGSRPASWRSSSTRRAARRSGSCCRTTTTCGPLREEQQARKHPGPATGADGITRTRLETGHGRTLATLFGTVTVTRCAWRKPGAPDYCPADAALSLPAGRHSHTLAKLAAIEAARGSFERRARRDRPPLRERDRQAAGSRSPSCTPPPISPRSTPPGSRSRARRSRCWSCRPTARAS